MADKIQRALLSVSDKTGIVELAKALATHKIHILSTGGTAKVLKEAGIAITEVSAHTSFPEIMGGRVKTLHPSIHGGILADRNNKKHLSSMEIHEIPPIDMVVVNLYPFQKTVLGGGDVETCIENIDIGGPAMIRSGAKNYAFITVLTNFDQYDAVIQEMQEHGGETTLATRQNLALQAFSHTAKYDADVSNWLSKVRGNEHVETLFNIGQRKEVLRYGENPHQKSALYATDSTKICVANAIQLQGKPLSYNNLNDSDVAFEMVCEYNKPSCAIIKHANPCGIASGTNSTDAFQKALSCDSQSAFGGILAFNTEFDAETANMIKDLFAEVIIAPSFTEDAKKILLAKTNLRVLETGGVHCTENNSVIKNINGAILVQDTDISNLSKDTCTIVTKVQPTDAQWEDLFFAFRAVKHVKSNAIVLARDNKTVGIGAGQMSRVDSAKIACEKADAFLGTKNAVVASDAFFPFPDALQLCINAGIKAVIQPGGSKNDDKIIALADEIDIPMVFTHTRHFKH